MNRTMTTTIYLGGEHLQNGMLGKHRTDKSPHYTEPNLHKLAVYHLLRM